MLSKKLLLALVVLVAGMFMFTACNRNGDAPPAPAPGVAPTAPTAPGTPIDPGTGAPVTPVDVPEEDRFPAELTIWGTNITGGIGADSNEAVWAWREIQERTGTNITWRHPTYGDADAFTLMIATGDWPDLIQTNWNTVPGGAAIYHTDRVILRLNDLIYGHMPNYLTRLNATGFRHAIEVGEDRNMYFITGIQEPYALSVIGPQIRQEWLDNVGLPAPRTTDELTNVLRAFRDNDPNQDGRATTPLTGFGIRALGPGATNFAMEMNLWPFGTSLNFYHINGEVIFGPLTAEFEEGVRWLRMLNEEGLMDPEWATNARADSDGRVMDGTAGYMPGIQMSGMHNNMAANHPDVEFNVVGVGHLSSTPGGPGFVFHNRFVELLQFAHTSVAITTRAENPEATARFLDFFWTDEATMLHNFGIYGVTYTYDANGNPVYTDYMMQHIVEGTWSTYTFHTSTAWPTFRRFDSFSPTLHPNAAEAMLTWGATMDTSRVLPSLTMSGAAADRVPTIMMDIHTHVEEMFVRFVNGVEPLDSFPRFRQELLNMNIQEAIDAHQEAFDLIRFR